MEKLSGSIYLNSVFLGLFRYSLNLITAFSDIKLPWLGRKHVHFIADAFAAVALVIFVIVYIAGIKIVNELSPDSVRSGMQVELANVLRACVVGVIGICSLLYTTNGVCSSELFPTPIRNTSFSFGQLLSRLGVVFSPLIFFLVGKSSSCRANLNFRETFGLRCLTLSCWASLSPTSLCSTPSQLRRVESRCQSTCLARTSESGCSAGATGSCFRKTMPPCLRRQRLNSRRIQFLSCVIY